MSVRFSSNHKHSYVNHTGRINLKLPSMASPPFRTRTHSVYLLNAVPIATSHLHSVPPKQKTHATCVLNHRGMMDTCIEQHAMKTGTKWDPVSRSQVLGSTEKVLNRTNCFWNFQLKVAIFKKCISWLHSKLQSVALYNIYRLTYTFKGT